MLKLIQAVSDNLKPKLIFWPPALNMNILRGDLHHPKTRSKKILGKSGIGVLSPYCPLTIINKFGLAILDSIKLGTLSEIRSPLQDVKLFQVVSTQRVGS